VVGVDDPGTWQWIWLAVAVLFVVGEMSTAGAFFMLPFGIGAGVATALAFLEVSIGWEWLAFVAVSAVAFAGMRPLARRLDAETPTPGVGAARWAGRVGSVVADIPEGSTSSGMVRVDREEWRAESSDGQPIAAGTPVTVVRVEGTRLVVAPVAPVEGDS
jgi:membrane protein implicated in regulation of membrane protease activity